MIFMSKFVSLVVSLVAWAHGRSPTSGLCIAGFSWGAAMAATAAVGCATALPPGVSGRLVAAVPYVGTPTSAVIEDGLMQRDIDWQSLVLDAPRLAAVLSAEASGEFAPCRSSYSVDSNCSLLFLF
jgi:dienelactone hydrolase